MSCRFDKDIIHKYLDNTIEPLELIILKEHLAVCQDCKLELELMTKLESSMYSYFEQIPATEGLDDFTMKVLDACYTGNQKLTYRQGLAKAWEINKMVATNASRCTAYLPGSKLAAAAAKKAGSGLNKAIKGYMKNSFKKLIEGAMK